MKKIILINKPIDWTSNDVVCKIKSTFGYKKVGHAGTLDPKATGLLLIGIEEGTKLLSKFILDDKEYETEFTFGIKTSTADISGQIIETKKTNFKVGLIKQKIDEFCQMDYYQIPHHFSAKKINGIRAYKLARNQQKFKLPPQLVKINKYEIISFDEKTQKLKLLLNVSKGFYIRSFCEDLAKKMKSIAFVSMLKRTKCGSYCLTDAWNLFDYLKQKPKN